MANFAREILVTVPIVISLKSVRVLFFHKLLELLALYNFGQTAGECHFRPWLPLYTAILPICDSSAC